MRKAQLVLPLLLTVALAACSRVPARPSTPSGPDTAGAPAAAQGVTTIRLLALGQDPALDAVVSAFHAKYPQYRVEHVPMAAGGDKGQVITTMVSQNDVDIMPLLDPDGMAGDNLLLDLEPFISKSHFDLNALGPGIDQMRLGGKLYDLPYGLLPSVILYNKEMFQAAGVPLPKQGWTWDDFRAAAQRLTSGTGSGKVWGFDSPQLPDLAEVWLLEKFGDPAQADEASLRQWAQYFNTLIQTDQSVKPVDITSGKLAGSAFAQGKAAMTSARLDDVDFVRGSLTMAWDVAPYPVLPGTSSATPVTVRSMGIAAKSKHPDAAWDFLRFLCGPEGATAVAHVGVALPVYNSPAVRQAWFDRQPAPPAGSEALFATRWQPQPRTGVINEHDVGMAFGALMDTVLSGSGPWDKGISDLLGAIAAAKALLH